MMFSSEFHANFAAFKISTNEIGINGFSFTRKVNKAALEALIAEPSKPFSWHASDDVEVHFFLHRENPQTFKLRHISKLKLSCLCAKCLEPVEHVLSLDFSILLLDQEALAKDSQDLGDNLFFNDQDLDTNSELAVAYFSHNAIDLGVVWREQIFIELPDYAKCGENNALSKIPCQLNLSTASEDMAFTKENPFVKHFKK